MKPCSPCAPRQVVSCLPDANGAYSLLIFGIESGTNYYWRIRTEQGNVFSKMFTFIEGTPIEITPADVPAGFFDKCKTFWIDIVRDPSNDVPTDFIFAHRVTEIEVEIFCGESYPDDNLQIGESMIISP